MSYSEDGPFLHPIRIAIPREIRAYLVALLNQTLACTVDLRSHVIQARWNVKGTDVVPLHVLFVAMATELDAYADLVAERIAVLGGMTQGTARMVATQSTLPEYSSDLVEGKAHVLALAERVASYATALRADIAHATDVEDAGSAAAYTDISRGVEKRLWFLEAYLHPCGARPDPQCRDGRKA
jgi:starvation-inducible DNA-binding protein